MSQLHTRLISLLIDLEYELRLAHLWSQQPPSADAMASTEPFCVDTMPFPHWLQYIFIPRMHQLLVSHAPLPAHCEITSMAETVWSDTPHAAAVIQVLRTFDEQINLPR